MVLKITKENWEKCGIKTKEHYNEKEDIIELWQKMSNIKIQLRHSNICHIVLERIRKYCEKNKTYYRRRKKKKKHFLKLKQAFSLLKNLHVI